MSGGVRGPVERIDVAQVLIERDGMVLVVRTVGRQPEAAGRHAQPPRRSSPRSAQQLDLITFAQLLGQIRRHAACAA
jgi:hypothetical protein